MSRQIEIDGDRWDVRLGQEEPHPGVRSVLFFPADEQRAYRVAEVAGARLRSQDQLDEFDDEALTELFQDADIMDYVHEPGAGAHHPTRPVSRPPDVGAE